MNECHEKRGVFKPNDLQKGQDQHEERNERNEDPERNLRRVGVDGVVIQFFIKPAEVLFQQNFHGAFSLLTLSLRLIAQFENSITQKYRIFQ